MTFAKPETTKEAFKDIPCSRCFRLAPYDDLVKYGSFCKACYDVYCYDVPSYPTELNKYLGDPKGWAKRIIDKHNAGENVRPLTLQFAREALKMTGEHHDQK